MNARVIFLMVGLCAHLRGFQCLTASCDITADPASSQELTGMVTFQQADNTSDVTVTIQVYGFDDSDGQINHGFHVHETGDISGGCSSAGGHYNPDNNNHGSRTDADRHVGDLGNIAESAGEVSTTFDDSVISLFGDDTIIGRAIVIHELADDYSGASGNAGSRLGCCVINKGSHGTSVNHALLVCALLATTIIQLFVK